MMVTCNGCTFEAPKSSMVYFEDTDGGSNYCSKYCLQEAALNYMRDILGTVSELERTLDE